MIYNWKIFFLGYNVFLETFTVETKRAVEFYLYTLCSAYLQRELSFLTIKHLEYIKVETIMSEIVWKGE